MTTTAAKYEIPAPCCAPGDAEHSDLDRMWACDRTAAIYVAGQWADFIDEERTRAATHYSERARRNLTAWADEQEERLANTVARGWWTKRECAGVGNPVPCGPIWGTWPKN